MVMCCNHAASSSFERVYSLLQPFQAFPFRLQRIYTVHGTKGDGVHCPAAGFCSQSQKKGKSISVRGHFWRICSWYGLRHVINAWGPAFSPKPHALKRKLSPRPTPRGTGMTMRRLKGTVPYDSPRQVGCYFIMCESHGMALPGAVV